MIMQIIKKSYISLAVTGVMFLLASNLYAAKYSGEFLELGVSARSLGMGGAYTAVVEDASASFYNPAGLSAVRNKSALFMHTETFGSLINHDYIGGALPLEGRNAGLGAALIRLGGSGIKLTELSNDPNYAGLNPYDGNIYRVSRTGAHADYTALFSYGTQWKPNTSVGITSKIIYRKLADETAFGLGIDLGVKTLLFNKIIAAAVLKDASATFLSYSTGTTESIYPNLRLGLAYEFNKSQFDFLLAGDAAIKFEHRDNSAQIAVGGASSDFLLGGEIRYKNRISGRLGNYRGDLTAGAGIRLGRFTIDAAFLNHDELDNSYRINLSGIF
ncbi:MAG: hypothetical protein GY855_17965 [candidate division Zixibacteria bacterium]|nr:hypothetical protein [candidate division Zixibacteria bacterium]